MALNSRHPSTVVNSRSANRAATAVSVETSSGCTPQLTFDREPVTMRYSANLATVIGHVPSPPDDVYQYRLFV